MTPKIDGEGAGVGGISNGDTGSSLQDDTPTRPLPSPRLLLPAVAVSNTGADSSHPLADPLGSIAESSQVAADGAPKRQSRKSTTKLESELGRSLPRGFDGTSRPGYFDLQRLAQQADLQGLSRDATSSTKQASSRRRSTRESSAGLESHDTSSSDADSVVISREQTQDEGAGVPAWLKESQKYTPSGRPTSRSQKRDEALQAGTSIVRPLSRATRPPSRTGAFSPASKAANNDPRSSTFVATPGPREDTQQHETSAASERDRARMSRETMDDEAEEERIALYVSMQHLDNAELLRLATAKRRQHSTSQPQKRPDLALLQSGLETPLLSPAESRSVSESMVLTKDAPSTRDPHEPSLLALHDLIRDLSRELAAAREETYSYKAALQTEQAKSAAKLSTVSKRQTAREEVLREILDSAGVSSTRVERALLQAQAQADVPIFDADERMTEQLRRARSPGHRKSRAGQSSTPKQRHLSEDRLPASLLEAMQEGLHEKSKDVSEGATSKQAVEGTTIHRPIAVASGGLVLNNSEDPQLQIDDQNAAARQGGLSPARSQDQSARKAAVSPSAAAGELMPWSGKTATRKTAPTVQTSVAGPGHVDDNIPNNDPDDLRDQGRRTPRPSRSRAGSRTSVVSHDPRKRSTAYDDVFRDDTRVPDSTSSAPTTGKAFDFFATIGWRKRKNPQSGKLATADPQASSTPSPSSSRQLSRSSTMNDTGADMKRSTSDRSFAPEISKRDSRITAPSLDRTDTVRAKGTDKRPEPKSTPSGADVAQALHDAIGSYPSSPSQEREPALPTQDLPKPAHFKAIFLATRIMTADPTSVVLGGDITISKGVMSSALDLVRGARDEGKVVKDVVVGKAPRTAPTMRSRSSTITSVAASARDVDARPARPTPLTPALGTSKTAATLSKALSSYAKTTRISPEPNVTRLPGLFGLVAGAYPQKDTAKARPGAVERRAPEQLAEASKRDASSDSNDPIVTELETVLAHDVRPPTFPLLTRHAKAQSLASRQLKTGSKDEDESSGDEFEVYGGKNLDIKHVETLATSIHRSRMIPAGEDALLTDRYGFVYDATPADVRLLRRARQESTHAPACLTGIRVGAAARGDSDDEEEAHDEATSLDSDNDEDDTSPDAFEDAVENESDSPSPPDASSSRASTSTASKTAPPKGLKLLQEKVSQPVTGQVDLSPASHTSTHAGPTSPSQERLHLIGQDDSKGDVHQDKPFKKPPSTSHTVKKLLVQLQDMHAKQQDEQQAKWDRFLGKRKARLREKQDLVGASENSAGSLAPASSARKAATTEEHWTLGGLIGLHKMSAGSQDEQEFRKLVQSGVPLVYRAKVWYECGGAGELTEPGRYDELISENDGVENTCTKQIDLDVGRTMPTNVYFSGDGPGVPKLRRLLVAYSWYNTNCGYCQGMNNLAATLLLTHASEEEAFWVLASIIERILPEDYYTSHLLVAQADQRVLLDFVEDLLPAVANHVRDLGVDLPAVTFAWFLSLYTDCLPVETLFRVWDVLFVEGNVTLFRVAVAIFMSHEKEILSTDSASSLYSLMHRMTSHLFCADTILRTACVELRTAISTDLVHARRTRHTLDLCQELGLETRPASAAPTQSGSGTRTPSASSVQV